MIIVGTEKFLFVLASLGMMLRSSNVATKSLQDSSKTTTDVATIIDILVATREGYRSDTVFNEILASVEKKIEDHDITMYDAVTRRTRKPSSRIIGYLVTTFTGQRESTVQPNVQLKSTHFEMSDIILTAIKSRFTPEALDIYCASDMILKQQNFGGGEYAAMIGLDIPNSVSDTFTQIQC